MSTVKRMDPEVIEIIAEKIYRKFPEVDGVWPKVRKQPVPQDAPWIVKNNPKFLLTFNTKVRGPGGTNIPRWVRVVAKPSGRIVKITTSK